MAHLKTELASMQQQCDTLREHQDEIAALAELRGHAIFQDLENMLREREAALSEYNSRATMALEEVQELRRSRQIRLGELQTLQDEMRTKDGNLQILQQKVQLRRSGISGLAESDDAGTQQHKRREYWLRFSAQ